MDPNRRAYSADVRMHLSVNGRILPIAQLGPDFLILAQPAGHPPAEAEITLSIDGHVQRWAVYLPYGIVPERLKTPIGACPSGANGATGS